MPTYYVKRSSDEEPQPEENWLIWFSGEGIEGCGNALLLYGEGEIHLLKTVRVVSRGELDELNFQDWSGKDYKNWERIFGAESASNELRTAYRYFRKVNDRL